ncbi:I78 family peptidase inhibitor [Bosea sp. BH3]|uniref:I78 family peptidase inhibitor n=1 Tax=Bosea sp. BH3 TaxID=2871701 RepID=UPI0021CB619C|nr:I78 family peptidase inhibitor [Bosea sp. BH3]
MPFDAKLLPVGALILAGVVLAACQSETTQSQTGAAPGLCRRDAAETLAGKDRVTDEQAMQITGAPLVRQIKPGQPVTMDFRQERVTIETDPKTGKILRAFCG